MLHLCMFLKRAEAINKDYSVTVRDVSAFGLDSKSPSGTFLQQFLFFFQYSLHEHPHTPSNRHNTAHHLEPHLWVTHFGYISQHFLFLCISASFMSDLPRIFTEIALNIEVMQWNMGRKTKLRTKFGRKLLELSVHQKIGLQRARHDNVTAAPYSLHLVVMVFVHLIMWPFKYFRFIST